MRNRRKQPVYVTHEPMTAHQVLEKAAEILATQFSRGEHINSPQATKDFLACKLAGNKREVFAMLLLDNRHRLIEYREMFYGTIDSASVHPREIVRAVMEANAASVILAHNHPSGDTEPSVSDKKITQRIVDALELIDVRVLDHIVIGKEAFSFAENNLL